MTKKKNLLTFTIKNKKINKKAQKFDFFMLFMFNNCMNKGFEAVYNKDSQVLILGSFPSVKSRKNGFYYGNKQNRFWKMLETLFDERISDDIETKKQFLLKHKIALYDVIVESDLKDSADSTLEKSKNQIGDFSFLLPPNSNIKKILCNGKTAYNLFTENCQTTIPVYCMPSTSPANPRYKFETWKDELQFLLK